MVGVDAAFGEDLQQRIATEIVMIVAVLVTHRDGEDALGQQRPQRMGNLGRITRIVNTRRQRVKQSDVSVHFPQKCCAGVGSDCAAGEVGLNIPPAKSCERQGQCVTVCHVEGLVVGGLEL